jgi:ubiquitin carboxyl-terminal hydrolase 34
MFLAVNHMALSADIASFPPCSDLAEQIISKYLFPELANENDEVIVPRTPHMHTETRQKLYSIIRLLCKRSDDNVVRIMQHLEGVIPRGLSHRILPLL